MLRRVSRRDEEGLSSCLARPCHHAVDNHPAGVAHRISPFAMNHAAFAKTLPARPPGLKVSRPPLVRLRYGLVTRRHPHDGVVGRLQSPGFPTATLLPKLRGSDSYPGGTDSHRTRQPSLDAQRPLRGSLGGNFVRLLVAGSSPSTSTSQGQVAGMELLLDSCSSTPGLDPFRSLRYTRDRPFNCDQLSTFSY